ncbi:MAG: hypothetical protein BIFFINMI_03422 [Phycisphaerae bacterium]|nr:hypothetical protein [Phycisphaerae bacterium]
MPRRRRVAAGGMVYHVINRANARVPIFEKPTDYRAFLRILADVQQLIPMRILAYCVMPNHWHMTLWPIGDGDLGRFIHRLTVTHVTRWHAHHETTGSGHLYQGRFKSFPIEDGIYLLRCGCYVEANPLRAGLVQRAEEWPWGSLWQRLQLEGMRAADRPVLADWPLALPRDWVERVNRRASEAEMEEIRSAVQRGRPFGSTPWQEATAARLGLEMTLRPMGRPKKSGPGPLSA